MNSMPISSSKEVLIKAEQIKLVFNTKAYKFVAFRDLIASLARDPVGSLLNEGDRVTILNNIDFEINRGDRIGLIGINGAGKTSLCRCIAGLYKPHGKMDRRNHKIRAIFDTAMGIQPELTGKENANLLLKFMYPEFRSEHPQMLEEICEFSELGKYLDVAFKNYSNGMQARICLSTISAKPSDLLILDEVFDGADQFFKKKIALRVQKMIAQSGAVIFVSHSKDQILNICNRLWYLKDGKIIFDGDPKEGLALYDQLGRNPSGAKEV